MHLIFNLIFQLLLGLPLEIVHKWWRLLIIYMAGVIGGRHYENLPMQNTENILALKIENFIGIKLIFLIFMLKTLIVSTRKNRLGSGSNGYPLSMFWIKNKKNRYSPVNPSFPIHKWGLSGYSFHGYVFSDGRIDILQYCKQIYFLRFSQRRIMKINHSRLSILTSYVVSCS